MRARTSRRGFTLIELIIVIAIIAIFGVLVIPGLLDVMWSNKVQLSAREAALQLREARFRAIQEGREYGVFADFANNQLVAFRGVDPVDPDGEQLRAYNLPAGIVFQGPGDTDPNGPEAVDFLPDNEDGSGGWVAFRADGSADAEGGIRFAMPQRNLYWETGVDPATTGRIQVRTYDGTEFIEP